ncbi:hypothetical protein QBC39DRAFT_347587 [Podospora conica]|nr:hypothetical protein QBC39DRAFT_347587 [Schizothecium conicum]
MSSCMPHKSRGPGTEAGRRRSLDSGAARLPAKRDAKFRSHAAILPSPYPSGKCGEKPPRNAAHGHRVCTRRRSVLVVWALESFPLVQLPCPLVGPFSHVMEPQLHSLGGRVAVPYPHCHAMMNPLTPLATTNTGHFWGSRACPVPSAQRQRPAAGAAQADLIGGAVKRGVEDQHRQKRGSFFFFTSDRLMPKRNRTTRGETEHNNDVLENKVVNAEY